MSSCSWGMCWGECVAGAAAPAGTGRCAARPWQGLGHGGAAELTQWQDSVAAGGRVGVLVGTHPINLRPREARLQWRCGDPTRRGNPTSIQAGGCTSGQHRGPSVTLAWKLAKKTRRMAASGQLWPQQSSDYLGQMALNRDPGTQGLLLQSTQGCWLPQEARPRVLSVSLGSSAVKDGEGDRGTEGRPHSSCLGPVLAADEVTQTVSEEDKEGQTRGGGGRERQEA